MSNLNINNNLIVKENNVIGGGMFLNNNDFTNIDSKYKSRNF